MSSTLFEIVELANGDVVLQRADEEDIPLVSIRFSEDAKDFMQEGKQLVVKAMIEAGIEAASELVDSRKSKESSDEDLSETDIIDHTVH